MQGEHPVLDLFFTEKKSELKGSAKNVVVKLSQLDQMIGACELRRLPWRHEISYREFLPPDIDLRKANAITAEGRKIYEQLLNKRRYLVGHIFFTADRANWHFLYFDQRDLSRKDNHWREGSHIHLINYLWPNWTAERIWEEFNIGNPQMSGALHIKFQDDMPRECRPPGGA